MKFRAKWYLVRIELERYTAASLFRGKGEGTYNKESLTANNENLARPTKKA